jgi:glycosyltransferase involved in cell wall biosynthesis
MQVVLSLNPGGTERLVVAIARRVAALAPSVVCCLDDAGSWGVELEKSGVEVFALGRKPGFRPSLGRRIARLAADRGVDVLHCHHYTPFVYGVVAALHRPSLRVIYTEHGRLSDAPPSVKRRLVNPLLGRLPAAVFAVSDDLAAYLRSSGFPRGRIRVVRNGVDPGALPSLSEKARARDSLGLSPAAFVAGTVARLEPVKDLAVLVQAFSRLYGEDPTMRLVVVGDGSERARLKQQAGESGCAGGILFTGHRDDARTLLAALDVYVNCSVTEGMSVTVLEAMAAGLAVVATRVGGNPELVGDGLTGILVPARSPESVAAALRRLSSSRSELRAMGAAGRARLETDYTTDRMFAEYVNAYRLNGGR